MNLGKINKTTLKSVIKEVLEENPSLLKEVIQELIQEHQANATLSHQEIDQLIDEDFEKYEEVFKALA